MAALAAAISLSDPEKRRRLQAEEVGGGDKEVVKDYFNKSGFERWKKIYRETDDVNRVQRDIRLGHSKTVENVIKMLTDEGPLQGVSVCDAGCGTGWRFRWRRKGCLSRLLIFQLPWLQRLRSRQKSSFS